MDEFFFTELKLFFKKHGITQTMIADALGVKQPFVNALLNGNKNITKSMAQRLHELYGLSVAWLLTGEGPMMAADVSSTGNTSVSVTAGANGVAVNGNNNTATATNGTPATDIIASLVEANRQLTEQNTKLINYILSTGKPLP